MAPLQSDLIVLSDFLRLQKVVRVSPRENLTTILYHHFFFGGESRTKARDRLKRQCDWLESAYTPLTATGAIRVLRGEESIHSPLLITIDDAHMQLLDALDIFQAFQIPITVFVCVGWTDLASPLSETTALARIVGGLHWYTGPGRPLVLDGRAHFIEAGQNAEIIDTILSAAEGSSQDWIMELAERLEIAGEGGSREICNWSDIVALDSQGIELGSHSVSHAMLGRQSETRLRFEIVESATILARKARLCPVFAYPYGRPGSFSQTSATFLRSARYASAFTTRPGLASVRSNSYELPRIVLPEAPMSLVEFKARVRGAQIPLSMVKHSISRALSSLRRS